MSYPAQANRPAALELQPFCSRLSLLVWEGAPSANIRRLRVRVNGSNAKPPFTQVSLRLAKDLQRIVLALGAVPEGPSPTLEILDAEGGVLARSAGAAISSRRADEIDVPALVAGLAGAERARLARFLIEVCGSLFRASADPTFIASIRAVLLEITAGPGRLTPRCALLDKYLFCETAVPASLGERLSAVCISSGAVRRVALPPRLLKTTDKRPDLASLGIVLERPAADVGGQIVIFGDGGLVCRTLAGVSERLPSAGEWLMQVGDSLSQHRRFLLDCLGRLGAADDKASSLLRELRLLTPGLPPSSAGEACLRATAELILPCQDGLFVSGTLSDPHRLAEALIIERDDVTRLIEIEDLGVMHAPASGAATVGEERFVFFAPERDPSTAATNSPVRLSLGLRSGARVAFAEGPSLLTRDRACKAVLDSISTGHSADETAFAYAEAALRGLMRAWVAPAAKFDAIDLGAPPAHPTASVVIPFEGVSELVRCRMGMFALDATMADVEVIYLAESAAQYRLAERVLGDLRLAYGLPSRLIVPDRALPKGAVLGDALRSARGPFVALLGPDVVPESPGWLVKLVSFLKGHPQRGIVGGQILYEDHSLVSAGLYVGADDEGRWALMPRLSGFPRDYAAAAIPTRAAAVSADCLVMSHALLQESGGPDDHYLLAHFACADLCLQARAIGREVGRIPEPAFFRMGEHFPPAGEAHYAACAEIDRRNLERRWRERLETSLEEFGRSKPLLHSVAAGEGLTQAKRAA